MKLSNLIPELRVKFSAPTFEDGLKLELTRDIQNASSIVDLAEEARKPIIERQLAAYRPKFDEETKNFKDAERESAWKDVVTAAHAPMSVGVDHELEMVIQQLDGKLNSWVSIMPTSEQRSVSEVLEKNRYQEVNLSTGPFDIADRVSKDGPRDIYYEIRKTLKDGQPYDITRPPSGAAPDATPTKAEARIMQQLNPSGNPVEAYL